MHYRRWQQTTAVTTDHRGDAVVTKTVTALVSTRRKAEEKNAIESFMKTNNSLQRYIHINTTPNSLLIFFSNISNIANSELLRLVQYFLCCVPKLSFPHYICLQRVPYLACVHVYTFLFPHKSILGNDCNAVCVHIRNRHQPKYPSVTTLLRTLEWNLNGFGM